MTVAKPVSGSTLQTINNVYRMNPNGWAERYPDPSSASVEMGTPEWYESSRELVHLSDRTSVDITDYLPLEATTPSGRSWALYSPVWSQTETGPSRALALSSWFPASTEPGMRPVLRSDAMEQILIDESIDGPSRTIALRRIDVGSSPPGF